VILGTEYECLWESGTWQCNRVLRAETGDYANHAIKELENDGLLYHFLFVFFTLHTQFLDILLLSVLCKLQKLFC